MDNREHEDEIVRLLDRAIAWSFLFADKAPDKLIAANKLKKEIENIKKNFILSDPEHFGVGSREIAFNIVNCFMAVYGHASLLAEENPDKVESGEKLKQAVGQIRQEFISAVISENSENKP